MTRKKILLVDDAETVLLMERMILGKSFDLVVARDGQEAVAKAASESPDLILLDVLMPGIDGFEACKQIRGDERTGDVPIIMVTTRGEPENMENGFRSGCTDYVSKPFTGVELLSKVKHYLGQ
jgi:PleD family two-component response regulator